MVLLDCVTFASREWKTSIYLYPILSNVLYPEVFNITFMACLEPHMLNQSPANVTPRAFSFK